MITRQKKSGWGSRWHSARKRKRGREFAGVKLSRAFRSFFIYELRLFFRGRYTLILGVLMLIFSLLFIQIGAAKYKSILKHKTVFQQHEQQKIGYFTTYTQYGAYGYRILFVPSGFYIFFIDAGVSPEAVGFVDSGARLNIYNSLKGDGVFALRVFQYANFAGIVLFFSGLLAVLYAFSGFSRKQYLKMLASIMGYKKLFAVLLLARAAVLGIVFLAVTGFSLLLAAINGIGFRLDMNFVFYLLLILLVSLFFFAMGAAAGNARSRKTGFATVMTAWFILMFIIPAGVQFYIQLAADHITPVYKLDMDNFKLLMDSEKRAINKAGTFDYGKKATDMDRKIMIDYYNNEFKKINILEKRMRNQMKKYMRRHQLLSIFFPTTYYLSVSGELSSSGYHNLLAFYKYVQDNKKDFFMFFIKNIYFNGNANFDKVKPFIRGDENLFTGTVRLPRYAAAGLVTLCFYTAVFLMMAFRMFRKSLFIQPGGNNRAGDSGSRVVNLAANTFSVVDLDRQGELFRDQAFVQLSGQKKPFKSGSFKHEIIIDGKELSEGRAGYSSGFLYACHPEHLPRDVKAGELLALFIHLFGHTQDRLKDNPFSTLLRPFANQRIGKLGENEKGLLLPAILEMKQLDIYLVNDAARGMPVEIAVVLKEIMEKLAAKGAIVLYFTGNDMFTVKSTMNQPTIYNTGQCDWCRLVDHYKELYDIRGIDSVTRDAPSGSYDNF